MEMLQYLAQMNYLISIGAFIMDVDLSTKLKQIPSLPYQFKINQLYLVSEMKIYHMDLNSKGNRYELSKNELIGIKQLLGIDGSTSFEYKCTKYLSFRMGDAKNKSDSGGGRFVGTCFSVDSEGKELKYYFTEIMFFLKLEIITREYKQQMHIQSYGSELFSQEKYEEHSKCFEKL
jgi:hypothetical protein